MAEAAAAPLDRGRHRGNFCRSSRPYLGVSPSALAQLDRQRRSGRSGQRCQGPADQPARIRAPLWAAGGLLHARAVGAGVRQSGEPAAGLGRSGRSGLLRKEMPYTGWVRVAGARAWHLCGPQRFRVCGGQRAGAQFPRPVSVGAEFRQRFADPEIQNRRHVRLANRGCGSEGAE